MLLTNRVDSRGLLPCSLILSRSDRSIRHTREPLNLKKPHSDKCPLTALGLILSSAATSFIVSVSPI
nr:MAG TPA: hypothetical protein [Caudoviricetes sp.]